MTKIIFFTTLCFCLGFFNACFAQNEPDALQRGIRHFIGYEIRGLKEFKKAEVISHDSFTQRSWIIHEMKELAVEGGGQKRDMEGYSEAATKKLALIKKQKQQHKPISNLIEELNDLIEKTETATTEFTTTLNKIRNKSELLSSADSVTIIKRIVVAKIIYTAPDDTLVLQKYRITFGKGYLLIIGRKEDD